MKTIRHLMPQVKGLGDVVSKVAKPIAKTLDKVAGTNLQNCGGCKRRQEYLNQKFPMKTPIIIALLTLIFWNANAQDFTYSTNLFYAVNYATNVYCGANSADTNRDTYIVAWNKLNHNDTWLNNKINVASNRTEAVNLSFTNYAATNAGLTTNYQIAIPLVFTNTLRFTNGILKAISSP